MFEGNTCYIYKNEAKEKLIIQVEPTDKYLESFRITNLPVELPIDRLNIFLMMPLTKLKIL